jgi:glycosyltransferase involved in cell wall biosynthesis
MTAGRIAFFLPKLSGGGAERVMLNLAGGVLGRDRPVDVVAASTEGAYASYVPWGARLVDLGAPRVLRALSPLVRYLRTQRPIAMISSSSHGNPIALLANRLARVPTKSIVTVHNSRSDGRTARTLRGRLLPYVLRLSYPWADAVVAVSHGVAQNVAGATGLPQDRVKVIYNPVITPDLLTNARAPVDHAWFAPGAPPVVLAVGRLTWEKDFPTLLRAFALIRQPRPARLLILGEGPERAALEAMVADLGLGEHVALPGWVSNPYTYMAHAAVFVLSSESEGLPTALIEAIAAGTPVVATDCVSGPREILQNGRHGRLVPVGEPGALAEAVLDVLETPQQPVAPEVWKPFSLDVAVDRYLELVDGVRA